MGRFSVHADCLFRADLDTLPAPGALFLCKKEFGKGKMRFRILAPGTAQGTSFQKYRSSNSGAIVDAISLDIEYDSLIWIAHRFTLFFVEQKHHIC
jgi:hypothetical protein